MVSGEEWPWAEWRRLLTKPVVKEKRWHRNFKNLWPRPARNALSTYPFLRVCLPTLLKTDRLYPQIVYRVISNLEKVSMWHPIEGTAWGRRGYLDHAFQLHNFTPALSSASRIVGFGGLEIRLNFQNDVQCAGKIISKISFQSWWDLEQIWYSWHTWATSKGSRTMESGWLDKRDKTWSGEGDFFFRLAILPSLTVWALR